jgi:hypothetical protein
MHLIMILFINAKIHYQFVPKIIECENELMAGTKFFIDKYFF